MSFLLADAAWLAGSRSTAEDMSMFIVWDVGCKTGRKGSVEHAVENKKRLMQMRYQVEARCPFLCFCDALGLNGQRLSEAKQLNKAPQFGKREHEAKLCKTVVHRGGGHFEPLSAARLSKVG